MTDSIDSSDTGPATCPRCGEPVTGGADAVRHAHRHIRERSEAMTDAEIEAEMNAAAVGDVG